MLAYSHIHMRAHTHTYTYARTHTHALNNYYREKVCVLLQNQSFKAKHDNDFFVSKTSHFYGLLNYLSHGICFVCSYITIQCNNF